MGSGDTFQLEVVSKVTGELLVSVEVDTGMTILELKAVLEPQVQAPASYQDLYKDDTKCADEFGLAGLRASGGYTSHSARVLLLKRSPTDPKALLKYLYIANEHWRDDPSDSSCLATVKYLLDSGIDPNLTLDAKDESESGHQWILDCPGATAAHCAAFREWDDLRYQLSRNSPQPEVSAAIFSLIFDHPRFTAADARCTFKDEGDFTILHAAAHGGIVAIVQKIIHSSKFTLGVNCVTSWSRSAFHVVASCEEYMCDGRDTVLRVFLDAPSFDGINYKVPCDGCGNTLQCHPIMPYAATFFYISDSRRCCKLLIEHPEMDLNCAGTHMKGPWDSFKGCKHTGGSIVHLMLRSPQVQCTDRHEKEIAEQASDSCCRVLQDKERFTDWNRKDSGGCTILHYAAGAGLTGVGRALLDCTGFTEVDSQMKTGETALHLAARGNHIQFCLMVMRDHRCTVPCPLDEFEMTPLHYSMESSMDAIMADVEGEIGLDLAALKCMLVSQPTSETDKPYPPCVSARRHAIVDAYRSFSRDKAFADLDMSNHFLLTTLLSAARVGAYTLCQSVIPEVPSEDLTAFCTTFDGAYGIDMGKTTMELICSRPWDDASYDVGSALETLKLLLPGMPADEKQAAFYIAASKSPTEIFTLLLEDDDIDVNQLSEEGDKGTVLHDASRADRLDHCRLILKSSRFNVADAKDRRGSNALMLAADKGALEVCRLLLQSDKFTAINDSDDEGNTALHMAAHGGEHGWQEIVDLILGDSRFTEANKANRYGTRIKE